MDKGGWRRVGNERNGTSRVVGGEGVYRCRSRGGGRSSILQCCLNSIDRCPSTISQIVVLFFLKEKTKVLGKMYNV